jgi:hypothetical protein
MKNKIGPAWQPAPAHHSIGWLALGALLPGVPRQSTRFKVFARTGK